MTLTNIIIFLLNILLINYFLTENLPITLFVFAEYLLAFTLENYKGLFKSRLNHFFTIKARLVKQEDAISTIYKFFLFTCGANASVM
jgi:hypothetical protein